MIAEDVVNRIETSVNSELELKFLEGYLDFDITEVIPGSTVEDGVLRNTHGDVIDAEKLRFIVSIKPGDIEMSDNEEDGVVMGHITSLVYKGDHYSYLVQTDTGEEIMVDDEDLWNMDDYVSLIIPREKVSYGLKKA